MQILASFGPGLSTFFHDNSSFIIQAGSDKSSVYLGHNDRTIADLNPFIATSIRIGRCDRCRCTCNGQDSVVPDSVLVGISCLYFQVAAKRDVRSVLDCQSRSCGRCRVDLCALEDQNTLCGVIDQHAFTIGKGVLDCTVERGCCRSGFCNGGFRIFPIITILRDRDIIAPLGQIQRLDFRFHRYISISGQGQFFTARYRLTVIFENGSNTRICGSDSNGQLGILRSQVAIFQPDILLFKLIPYDRQSSEFPVRFRDVYRIKGFAILFQTIGFSGFVDRGSNDTASFHLYIFGECSGFGKIACNYQRCVNREILPDFVKQDSGPDQFAIPAYVYRMCGIKTKTMQKEHSVLYGLRFFKVDNRIIEDDICKTLNHRSYIWSAFIPYSIKRQRTAFVDIL